MNSISSYENDVISLKDYLLNNNVKESLIDCSSETINSFIYSYSKKNSIDEKENFCQRNKTIIEILYGTGIRVSELIELRISNIFFKENIIRVLGKGEKERFVPLGIKAKKSINDYINTKRSLQRVDESSNDILILSKYGK